MSSDQYERLNLETPGQRDERLDRMSYNQTECLKMETPSQKLDRLKRVQENKAFRLQNETPLERDYRQKDAAERRRETIRGQGGIFAPAAIESQENRLHTLGQDFGTRHLRKKLAKKIDDSRKYWESRK